MLLFFLFSSKMIDLLVKELCWILVYNKEKVLTKLRLLKLCAFLKKRPFFQKREPIRTLLFRNFLLILLCNIFDDVINFEKKRKRPYSPWFSKVNKQKISLLQKLIRYVCVYLTFNIHADIYVTLRIFDWNRNIFRFKLAQVI